MAPVRRLRSDELSIELLDDQTAFLPGDIILGRVVRRKHTDSSNADVYITICGHVKALITKSNGENSTFYRSEFQLINDSRRTQRLASGPLSIPKVDGAEESWSFSIQVPLHVDATFEGIPGATNAFLPTAPGEVASHQLPGTYVLSGYDDQGLIEYWLKATVNLVGKRKPETFESILPVTVNTVIPGPPVTDHQLHHAFQRAQVATHRLVPDMADAKLSLSQRTRQFFGSSKVPIFAGNLVFIHATVLQLESRSPLPILARFVPDGCQSSEEISRRPPQIRLTSLIMSLVGTTWIRSNNVLDSSTSQQAQVVLWPPPRAEGDRRPVAPVYIPCSADFPPTDIGEHVRLRLGRKGIVGMPILYPAFTTYYIKRSYNVRFEIGLDIAGETTKHKFESVLNVIPPVDTRLYQPIEESLPPPSFGEATSGPHSRTQDGLNNGGILDGVLYVMNDGGL